MKNENPTAHELSAAVSDFIDTLCNIADENNKNRDDLINTAGSLLCFLTHTTTFHNNCPKETLTEKHWKECMQIAQYDNELNGNRGWIPCKDRVPENDVPVNIVWTNRKPASYYAHIKDKPFVATGVCHNGVWHWYSSVCVDYLREYGNRYDVDAIDKDIDVLFWMPLPAPPVEKKENEDENAD